MLDKILKFLKNIKENLIASDPTELSIAEEVKNNNPMDEIYQQKLKMAELSVKPAFNTEMLKVEDDEAFNKMVDNIIDCYHSKGYLVFMSKLQNNGSEDRINQNLVVSKGYKNDDLKIAVKEFEKLANEILNSKERK